MSDDRWCKKHDCELVEDRSSPGGFWYCPRCRGKGATLKAFTDFMESAPPNPQTMQEMVEACVLRAIYFQCCDGDQWPAHLSEDD